MKKGIHPKMQDLNVSYPDETTLKMQSVFGGVLSVEISKSKHPA